MKSALIVAHGQPSAPEGAAAANRALAAAVQALLPADWQVLGPTLAEASALEAAVAAAPERAGLVYPMFMADGWFTQSQLPRRLQAAGAVLAADRGGWQILPPFGLDPRLWDLAALLVQEAGGGARDLLVAAHGSFRSAAPARVAGDVAGYVQSRLGLARAEAGFIDQAPRLADMRGFGTDAICLPFFAAAGGHVSDDLPRALTEAGFAGRVLPAIGLDARVPALIAAALLEADARGSA